jgi:hypothetical protein
MIGRSIAFAGLFLVSQAAFSEDLFRDCSTISGDKAYKLLSDYFASATIDGANYCQRLNNYEFVYATSSNFHFCNFRMNGTETCVQDEQSIWYPNLDIDARFTAANGKCFVLFKTSRLSHGVYGSGYYVFFFTPKNDHVRDYKISYLRGAGEENGSYSDAGEICSNLASDARATSGVGYEILNEGTKNLAIRFEQTITSCNTGAQSTETLKYVWTGRDFVQTVNRKTR